ncbi:MAG: hypothetical protein OXI96_05230 [Acidimicrobiaceae bacterium]|nr:hypothetical protein [Acidimicrobiaceae bacterium]
MVLTSKTESERIELTSQLEKSLGTDTARTLMAHIPPINTEQLATKDDLIMVKKDIDMVRNEVKMVETRLNSKIDTKTAELDTKIERLDSKVDAGFKEIRSEMVLGFAQQSKKIFVIGLSLALPTWIALIGVLITLVITIISL